MSTPAREIAKAVVVERPRRLYRMCPYCGQSCRGPACRQHRDLIQIERELCSPTDQGA